MAGDGRHVHPSGLVGADLAVGRAEGIVRHAQSPATPAGRRCLLRRCQSHRRARQRPAVPTRNAIIAVVVRTRKWRHQTHTVSGCHVRYWWGARRHPQRGQATGSRRARTWSSYNARVSTAPSVGPMAQRKGANTPCSCSASVAARWACTHASICSRRNWTYATMGDGVGSSDIGAVGGSTSAARSVVPPAYALPRFPRNRSTTSGCARARSAAGPQSSGRVRSVRGGRRGRTSGLPPVRPCFPQAAGLRLDRPTLPASCLPRKPRRIAGLTRRRRQRFARQRFAFYHAPA